MEKKWRLVKVLGIFLFSIVFIFGLFAILIVSHEAYHYFSVSGEPVGVCFGNCASGNQGMMISGVYFPEINTEKTNIEDNEKNAWNFSLAFTGLIALLSAYSLIKHKF